MGSAEFPDTCHTSDTQAYHRDSVVGSSDRLQKPAGNKPKGGPLLVSFQRDNKNTCPMLNRLYVALFSISLYLTCIDENVTTINNIYWSFTICQVLP